MTKAQRTWALAAVVLLGLLARAAVLAPMWSRVPDDPDDYLLLARNIAEGRGLSHLGRPTAYRPPLYPLLLAPLTVLGDRVGLGVAALHLVLGAGTIVLTYAAARRWGLEFGPALLAATVVALDPVLVAQARAIMTETLAAFLIAAALAASGLKRCGATACGVAFGLASLCRPSFLPAAALAALGAMASGPGSIRVRILRGLALGTTCLAVLVPWAARNWWVLGEPVATTTHGGYTLALANNPVYYADVLDGPPGAVWTGANQRRWFEEINARYAGWSEPKADRAMRDEALTFAAAHPGDFLRAAFDRLARLWAPAPSGQVYSWPVRLAVAVWSVPLGLLVLRGLFRPKCRTWPGLTAPAILIALTVVHTFYWTDLRMRAPVVPALALVAVLTFERNRKNEKKDPGFRC